MIITLDVFSGRPNPTWKLNEKDAKKFVERFASRSVVDAASVEAPLGYRGFSIAAASDLKLPDNIAASFHVGGTLVEGFKTKALKSPLLSLDETDEERKERKRLRKEKKKRKKKVAGSA